MSGSQVPHRVCYETYKPRGDTPMAASAVDTPHAPTAARAAVRTEHLTKIYGRGEATVHALDRVTLEIAAGQYTAIMGQSGSGKSTLLHCIAGLDSPSGGRVWIGETEILSLIHI